MKLIIEIALGVALAPLALLIIYWSIVAVLALAYGILSWMLKVDS